MIKRDFFNAEKTLEKGFIKTGKTELLVQYNKYLHQIMKESFQGFLNLRSNNTLKKTQTYEDEIFSFFYPENFSSVKRDVAVVLHNAPDVELLEKEIGKYFVISIIRLPPILELNWQKDFWTPILEKNQKDNQNVQQGVCTVMGMRGNIMLSNDSKTLKINDPHYSIQLCVQSEKRKIIFC